MTIQDLILIIIGIIFVLALIFGLPRKKNKRIPNIEGLDSPEVAKAFNRMTKLPPFKILYNKVVSQIKKYNPKGKLADVGCGAGNLVLKIAKKIPELDIVGVDIAPEILEYAKNRVIKNSLDKKIEFKIGSVEKLPFLDNSINFIISTFSLHHWENPNNAFKEINRVLKKEGTFLIFDFRRDSRKFYYGLFKFVTKVIVPKALKKVNEPLGSIQASYSKEEISQFIKNLNIAPINIKSFLAWMFITNT